MSQEFRLRFDQMRENNPHTQPVGGDIPAAISDTYFEPGHSRNICFCWSNGQKLFLNYSYLVSGEYMPEQGAIILQFTSHHVVVTGSGLESLYVLFMHQMAKLVVVSDLRYESLEEANGAVVHSIIVTKMD